MASPSWITLYIDEPATAYDTAIGFWSAVTGWPASEPDGDEGEYVEFLPPDGDYYLGVQRLGSGRARVHIDLAVEDREACADQAAARGATIVGAFETWIVMLSPGGLAFCFVEPTRSVRPSPGEFAGRRSMLDQVCIGVPQDLWDAEVAFWRDITGWDLTTASSPEFTRLTTPDACAVRILLQRLEDREGSVTAHLDVAAEDREAEIARHVALGARRMRDGRHWTVMEAPTGATYCITERNPVTGALA